MAVCLCLLLLPTGGATTLSSSPDEELGEQDELVELTESQRHDDLDYDGPFDRQLQDLNSTTNTTESSRNETETPGFVPIIEGLSESTLFEIQVPGTPQWEAYQWLLEDPNVESYDQQALKSRFAMASLYYGTGGEIWTRQDNWLSYNHSICQWYSSLDDPNIPFIFPQIDKPCNNRTSDNLQHLVLADQDMVGFLPKELGLMTQLTSLYLSNNKLFGAIPQAWSSLTNVIHLSLGNNNIGGNLPSQLYSLTNLQRLDLSQNSFRGPIPTEIGNLRSLIALVLEESELTNPIPSELGLISTLEYFDFGKNARRGSRQPLFSEIGLLTNLEYLSFEYSFILEGGLPDEFFDMTSLVNLDLKGAGQLDTTLPTLIGQLTNLETLELTQATLYGPLPSELGLLTNLVNFNAELNRLNSTIPTQVQQMTSLRNFLVCNNQFTGAIPQEMGSMSSLDDLHLCGSAFTGAIPASLGQLTLMTHLDLKGNFLTGQVPIALDQLTASQMALEIQDNDMTGTVPAEVCSSVAVILADCLGEIQCGCCVQCF